MTHTATTATVTNANGESVTVNGPSIEHWAPMDAAWKATYRPVMLDIASDNGLELHSRGMRVEWKREPIESEQTFTPADEIPADAAALSWAKRDDGIIEKTFTTVNIARRIYRENHARAGVPEYGYIILGSAERRHGVFAW